MPELLRRTGAVLDQIPGGPHEVVFVDDGSSDGTLEILENAARGNPRVMVISLSRNFGHQAALTAALDYVSGDAVVLMDGDLQDIPETITEFVKRYQEGYDVVYATRASRKESWYLRLCYFLFYRLQTLLSDTRLPLDAGDFGLMSRRVVEQIRRMPEHHRYLRGLRSWLGFRQIGIPVERAERHSGQSKYGMWKLLKLASDGIFAYSIVPLRAAALLGSLAIGFSTLFAGYSLFAKIFLSQSPRGFTALVFLITFLSGVLLLFLGIIGEYVGRIYEEIKARPLYIVKKVIDHNSSPAIDGDVRRKAENA
ncbi:MAG: glycosyltransferase family 2 protein, partial [Candidatus Korobacteraceae bacterium]